MIVDVCREGMLVGQWCVGNAQSNAIVTALLCIGLGIYAVARWL